MSELNGVHRKEKSGRFRWDVAGFVLACASMLFTAFSVFYCEHQIAMSLEDLSRSNDRLARSVK